MEKFKKMNWFVKIITFGWPVAITLAPFGIYIKEEYFLNVRIRNHERIHWRQQMEMFILFFYIWYFLEWIVKLFFYGKESYRNLSFEREARKYQLVLNYLKVRKFWAWLNFI